MLIHGKKYHPLYGKWKNMKNRCYNKNVQAYKNYGGRGIVVCQEWMNNFQSFYDWAINSGWRLGLEIDRIDNDGNYEPNNCRWATHQEQCNNQRKNIRFEMNGEIKTLAEWSEGSEFVYFSIHRRIFKQGLSFIEAYKLTVK